MPFTFRRRAGSTSPASKPVIPSASPARFKTSVTRDKSGSRTARHCRNRGGDERDRLDPRFDAIASETGPLEHLVYTETVDGSSDRPVKSRVRQSLACGPNMLTAQLVIAFAETTLRCRLSLNGGREMKACRALVQ